MMGLRQAACIILAVVGISAADNAAASAPTGIFLWYPDQAEPPSSEDCEALVSRVNPSREKAEAWFWGRVPQGTELEFYLFLSKDRMEPTFSAEGDYDTGELRLGSTVGDETAFDLIPDDHPTVAIRGSIIAPKSSPVLTVVLRDVPSVDAPADRVTYYCRFAEVETEA
ncbi:hypothetical protein [Aquibium carbonis]|jgi:hypothetical protein|uniref:hypothetical protein n=1 Tax=Aquibium carbonis TaxID=2495581 RepID=UPI001FE0D217|nr:hypothetical protein [Aquibium carbonis]